MMMMMKQYSRPSSLSCVWIYPSVFASEGCVHSHKLHTLCQPQKARNSFLVLCTFAVIYYTQEPNMNKSLHQLDTVWLWLCGCGCVAVTVVVWQWLCGCGCGCVAVVVWLCGCGCVAVVVWL